MIEVTSSLGGSGQGQRMGSHGQWLCLLGFLPTGDAHPLHTHTPSLSLSPPSSSPLAHWLCLSLLIRGKLGVGGWRATTQAEPPTVSEAQNSVQGQPLEPLQLLEWLWQRQGKGTLVDMPRQPLGEGGAWTVPHPHPSAMRPAEASPRIQGTGHRERD